MMVSLAIILALLCIGQFIYICHTKSQLNHWLDILQSVKRGDKNKIFVKSTGLMANISYEINGIMKDNEAQIALLRKTEEANKQILTSLSHDVRTPLASLLGYLEALNKGLPDANGVKEYISVAYRKANDLKAFIDMLFEWFRLNSKEQQFSFEPADINEATREILIDWLPVFEQSNIRLLAAIGDDDLTVSLDMTAYKRILNNLIQNAIKHGDCTQITVSIKSHNGTAQIDIANDGKTIPAQHLPHIFERLYKGETSRTDKGSGLGLAITKELVTALNGEITVSSTQGKDTVFSITLPISKHSSK